MTETGILRNLERNTFTRLKQKSKHCNNTKKYEGVNTCKKRLLGYYRDRMDRDIWLRRARNYNPIARGIKERQR
jgi:hypothetical protein